MELYATTETATLAICPIKRRPAVVHDVPRPWNAARKPGVTQPCTYPHPLTACQSAPAGRAKVFALIKPVTDQLPALVIERARVATGIIPDRPAGVWKVLLLTRRKRTANRVVLVAGN